MLQLAVAVSMGIVIFATAKWAINILATPLPPEPDPDEVAEVDVDYRCTVCGLRLTVTHAQDAAVVAPRHCREEMVEA